MPVWFCHPLHVRGQQERPGLEEQILPTLEPSTTPGEKTDPTKPPESFDSTISKGSKGHRWLWFGHIEYVVQRRAFNRFRDDPVEVTTTRTVATGETRQIEQRGNCWQECENVAESYVRKRVLTEQWVEMWTVAYEPEAAGSIRQWVVDKDVEMISAGWELVEPVPPWGPETLVKQSAPQWVRCGPVHKCGEKVATLFGLPRWIPVAAAGVAVLIGGGFGVVSGLPPSPSGPVAATPGVEQSPPPTAVVPSPTAASVPSPATGFKVVLAGGHVHNGPGNSTLYECFGTDPAQPGAPYTSTVTRPDGTQANASGSLDGAGKATVATQINQYGPYTQAGAVTSGGATQSQSIQTTVTAAQGTKPC